MVKMQKILEKVFWLLILFQSNLANLQPVTALITGYGDAKA